MQDGHLVLHPEEIAKTGQQILAIREQTETEQ